MIDLHCHVLPDIDDGPRTLEESVAVCRVAYADGIRTMIATPHVNRDYPDVTAAAIEDRVAAVNRALHEAAVDVRVGLGAEVALSRVGELSDAELRRLTLGGGSSVLLELPWTAAGAGSLGAMRAFAGRGYGIVLAHPERSRMLQRNEELVADLVRLGARCCLDVVSLTDRADRPTRALAWKLLSTGLAHVIASDCHDATRRPPRIRSVLEGVGFTGEQIDYFTRRGPLAILAGDPVAPPPEVEDRSPRRWRRWS